MWNSQYMQNSSFQNFRLHFLINYGSLLFWLPHCQRSTCPVKASSLRAKDISECVAWYWTSPSRPFLNTGTNLKVSFIFLPDFWPGTRSILSFGLWFASQYHADTILQKQAARSLPGKGTLAILIYILQQIRPSFSTFPQCAFSVVPFHHLAIWSCETGRVVQEWGKQERRSQAVLGSSPSAVICVAQDKPMKFLQAPFSHL